MNRVAIRTMWQSHRRIIMMLGCFLSVCAFDAAAADVTLTWDPVSDPLPDHYEVHWGTTSGNYIYSTEVFLPPATVGGLTSGQTYYFSVRSCLDDTSDCSDYAPELSTTPSSEPVPLNAGFTASALSGAAPLTVSFSDTSTGDIDGRLWEFGDGSTSDTRSPTHIYNVPGTYVVSLTVSGPGGSDQEILPTAIEVSAPPLPPPVADFFAEVQEGFVPLEVHFTNTSSNATTFTWEFGDGSSSSAAAPVHTYTRPGSYSVKLVATGAGGTATNFQGGYINVIGADLAAALSADVTTGQAPLEVGFTSESSGEVAEYRWDFGDGATSDEMHPVHSYEEPGIYTVSLTVSGDQGMDTETRTDLITVEEPPPLDGLALEAGEVSADHSWTEVTLNGTYENPIVVANPMSMKGGQPAVVQVRNVSAEGFEIRVHEWSYLDGWHWDEKIGYLVVEAGRQQLPDGNWIEAGSISLDASNPLFPVAFEQAFLDTPVIITTVASDDDLAGTAVTTRIRNTSAYGFQVGLQKEEALPQEHGEEQINYIAWSPSMGIAAGYQYEVGRTDDSVNHGKYQIDYLAPFASEPVFIADMQTTNGGDTANLRWFTKTNSSVTINVDEEQSGDTETRHVGESVGYIVIDRID